MNALVCICLVMNIFTKVSMYECMFLSVYSCTIITGGGLSEAGMKGIRRKFKNIYNLILEILRACTAPVQ